MVFKDYYKILGLDQITSDQEKIKEAYKKQAKKYHPDINKNITNEFFNDIYESYQVLSNANKKRAYDRLWLSYIARDKKSNKTYEHKRRNITIEQEFKNLFLGESLSINLEKRKKEKDLENGIKTKEKNIVVDLKLTIEEAYFGGKKEITFKNLDNKEKTIFLNIPRGIKTGEVLRVQNFEKKLNFVEKTNLLVEIEVVNTENLKLDNLDLHTKVYAFPWEFALGNKISLNILNENIAVFIPEHTTKNFSFKLPQKGFINKNGFRGNLFIDIEMRLPDFSEETDLDIYKEMKNIYEKKQKINN